MKMYTGQKRKIELNELFGDKINLLLPQRNLIMEFEDLYMVDVLTKEKKMVSLILFSDCIIVLLKVKALGKSAYYSSTEFHENSFIYAKSDLKYYQNLFKIVGKTKWFIFGAETREYRDKVVSMCSEYIFSFKMKKQKRHSALGVSDQYDTHIDVEIVCTEWQGEKLVYVLELTKSITTNKYDKATRKNGRLIRKLFKRYSNVEEYHKAIWSQFNTADFPKIPQKTMLYGSKTEVIERRRINFELFLQTIMLGAGSTSTDENNYLLYFKTRKFFKFDYLYAKDEKSEKLSVHFCHRKNLEIKVSQESTSMDILNQVAEVWDIRDIDAYRVSFVHNKYGEKLLDNDEWPLNMIENFESHGITKLFGKKVTKKMSSDILDFFDSKSHIFYVKRVVFKPQDYSLEFRMKDDELKLRFFQAVFDLKVENIILSIKDYEEFWGLRAFIVWGSVIKREHFEIVPFKEIKSLIPVDLYKKQKNDTWETNIIAKWTEFSEKLQGKEEAMLEFLLMIAKKDYYGSNMFWVENYKYNKQSWLQKNMWMAVRYDSIIFWDEKSKKKINQFDINEWKVSHFPNAIILSNKSESTIRLTTTTVYPIYWLIKMYQKIRYEKDETLTDFEINKEQLEKEKTDS